tara:strand:- start:133 stop:408 length:276 start_codon:yes stop_codon:yes gene_type:complete
MKALIDLGNVAVEFDAFGNYYGNLVVFEKDSKYSMSVANYTGHDPSPIPDYLFEALMKHAEESKDFDRYHGGVTVYDLNTEEGRESFESSY